MKKKQKKKKIWSVQEIDNGLLKFFDTKVLDKKTICGNKFTKPMCPSAWNKNTKLFLSKKNATEWAKVKRKKKDQFVAGQVGYGKLPKNWGLVNGEKF